MLKELYDRILEQRPFSTVVIDGKNYSDRTLKKINPNEKSHPRPLEFQTLSGLISFLNSHECMSGITDDAPILHIESHTKVSLKGQLQPKNQNERFTYAFSIIKNNPFHFGHYMDLETFIVSLQSQFDPSDTVEQIISVLGNLANEHIVENKDDGFSQSINLRTGITTKSKVKIENPIRLYPYRTFREVEQPASDCILRLRKTDKEISAALYEADGGAWKLYAVRYIRKWLEEKTTVTILA